MSEAVLPSQATPRVLGGDREQAILRATYDLVAEVGYEALRFDAVAARARASKATLYRHWPSKAKLVADAVRVCKAATVGSPDTGSLRGDLVALVSGMAEAFDGEEGPVFAGLVMAMRTDPSFAAEMRAMHISKHPVAAAICAQAVARGELRPDCSVGLIEELVPGLLFMRSFAAGEKLDEPFIAHLVDDILLPLLTR